MRTLKRLVEFESMSTEDRIQRITLRRVSDSDRITIRAEAEVCVANVVRVIVSSGMQQTDAALLKQIEDGQLAELRKRLYEAGFSKRAIAEAVKGTTKADA
jgi:hypothetical protein